jgi:hypothetical protein
MPSETTELKPKGKPVIARILIPLGWTLWGVLVIVLLYWLIKVSTEGKGSPEAGPGLGIFAVVFALALVALAGVLLNTAARKQSPTGLITMTLVLLWPLVFMIADPLIRANKARRFASDEAAVGDFKDPTLEVMARAITANDTATLHQLLKGQPPPGGKDRAGNDLLLYALVVARDKRGSAEPVRVLLEAGADPRKSRAPNGEDVVAFMIYGGSPGARDAMRLLLEHGADPNAVDAQSGKTPIGAVSNEPEIVRALVDHGADIDRIQPDGVPAVVGFIGTRQWESALYLIEKGANLDVTNSHGLSVDYYLNDWKESVFGEHPEGWDKVREAIAKRRAART